VGALATAAAGLPACTLAGAAASWRWEVAGAGVLVGLEVAVVAAVAMAAAVRLGAVGTLGAGLATVVAGHLPWGEWLSDAAGEAGGWAAALVPGLERLNVLEAAAAGWCVAPAYVAWAALYATMYSGAALLVGAALMHGREVA
jgi:hypothetical protein